MFKNPFEILGLSPEMVAKLPEKDLFGLVKNVYRTLLKTYHPDKAVKRREDFYNKKTIDLNLAFEKLNLIKNPKSFRLYRKSFAARRPSGSYLKNLSLKSEIDVLKNKKDDLGDNFFNYLRQQVPWLNEDESKNYYSLFGGKDNFSTGCLLGLTDVAIGHNLKGASSWSVGSNYKELKLIPQKGLFIKPVGRRTFNQVGFISLLGTVPVEALELWPILEKEEPNFGFFKSLPLNAKVGIDGVAPMILNAISIPKFKDYCLPLLESKIREQSYLFSINRPVYDEKNLVSLEGVVVKISKLNDI